MKTSIKPDDCSEDANRTALRNDYAELLETITEFGELWRETGQGGSVPPTEDYRPLLRRIAARARTMENTFAALEMFRDFPGWTFPQSTD